MGVTTTGGLRRRPVFHPLAVARVDRITDDAVAVSFAVPPELRERYAFQAGQHLTVRVVDPATGRQARRSYSICSTPAELTSTGRLRIGVKEIPGGTFSSHAVRALRAGDTVEVMPPLGHFTTGFDPGRARHYAAVVAGSGITPVLSLLATALAVEPASRFTLVYGNRYLRGVMFVEELADLKDRYPARLHLVHVLSQEPGGTRLLSGRVDAERLTELLDTLVPAGDVDEWFLCGPYGMVTDARAVLTAYGVPDGVVHVELFHVDSPAEPARRAERASPRPADVAVEATVVLDGRASTFRMGRHERVLDAALRVRAELPYACTGGVCSTCRARLVEGEVSMARNHALEPAELAAGHVLTCQANPVSDRIVVDYDA